MNAARLRTLIGLELTQRMRSVAWYVLLGVFAAVLIVVTVLSFLVFGMQNYSGPGIYSAIVYIVLLLVVLVSPTLSGNAINGDREAATLAPVQITLATTGEIIIAKFLAAWITGLAFVVVAVPFLLIAMTAGGVNIPTVIVSLLVLIFEIGIVSAIGVGLSGLIAKPLFSVTSTYLVVAALTIGTLIIFGLAGASIRSTVTSEYRYGMYEESGSGTLECGSWETSTYETPRFDYVWWTLAANPFVILADATPTSYDPSGYPDDVFGQIKYGLRSAQIPPDLNVKYDDCNPSSSQWQGPDHREVIDSTVPSWFVGMALQVVLAAALLFGAYSRTRTPARRLPPGTRIA
ncbi:ABC-type transport system involved in multi-copper enzyme maturation permease subunit [Microbacterium halimionae]|uniref:ABC-type transport system involved in multi-copper enzyme maturation permease subunit n=1 Tax=Microbacterium halimionae TaxID=1526413 RepID=A0A7W3JPN7_9MICO|nr:ABC transporter permease [Microbacterium halimionae]MBA8816712.1 ABC-type transport system involved in multi-copper enzyme maturation permease subunit [Microbacterium halimionae]NII94992.1 ABC-type transport system involved in multi-copper enzyme maturation permease subunit [Microbacterium halimionae]